ILSLSRTAVLNSKTSCWDRAARSRIWSPIATPTRGPCPGVENIPKGMLCMEKSEFSGMSMTMFINLVRPMAWPWEDPLIYGGFFVLGPSRGNGHVDQIQDR